MTEKPCIEELYSLAMSSNHLELSPNKRGAADFLLAVGMSKGPDGERESLGSMLMRLTSEYACAHGEHIQSRRNHARQLAIARQIRDTEIASRIEQQAEFDALMAHQHVLLKLPSLSATKEAFGNWSMAQARKQRFMNCGEMPAPDGNWESLREWRNAVVRRKSTVSILAGRVLDVFLQPHCLRCSGRGFSGGYNGTLQTICPTRNGCGGSGKRALKFIGNSSEQHAFSYHLYCQAERLVLNTKSQISRRLSSKEVAP